MKICNETAIRLWTEQYGYVRYARDFHGNLMSLDAYGRSDIFAYDWNVGAFVACGWNIHHILPLACGGSNEKHNLICTNIETNEAAEDKTTFWIDECLYQVQRVPGTGNHCIVRLE